MLLSRKEENGTSSAALLGSQDCGQSAAENLTFQRMQHGFIPSATSSSLEIKGLASEQSVNKDSMTSPVLHHYQADLADKATLWGSSSKQSMQPFVVQGKGKPFMYLCNGLMVRGRFNGGRHGGLMVSALDSGATAPGSSPGRGHCVVFLGKTLYSHGASLHPGV